MLSHIPYFLIDLWYSNLYFVTLDETTGKEKKTSELYLVQSDTLESAESDVKSFLNDGNTTISSISETAILDVFPLD